MKHSYKRFITRMISIMLLLLFILLTVKLFDPQVILGAAKELIKKPQYIFIIFAVYFLSFCCKALVWKWYLKGKPSFLSCLLGILYSLLVNHIVPIKIGDFVRVGVLYKRGKQIGYEETFHSVFVLRILDMISLVLIAFIGLVTLKITYQLPVWLFFIGGIIAVIAIVILRSFFTRFWQRQMTLLKEGLGGRNLFRVPFLTFVSWFLEAGVIFGTAMALGGKINIFEAAFVNSMTVAGQIFQVTPGGIANYESIMVLALSLLGVPLKLGYTMAILTHGLKFLFSYMAGVVIFLIYPVSIDSMRGWLKMRGVRGK